MYLVSVNSLILARIGVDQEADFLLFSSPPVDLLKTLEDDCNGVYFNKPCTSLDVVVQFNGIVVFNPKKKKNFDFKCIWFL